ncbi:ankyrin repeat domain-containing protein [Legionella cardiaca]|uniref:Ankyrin repeat domain-containing protein n=1 Tax=Legionella cardiaca TaxID=1071983 RepID=A0ABY8AXM0_9GAMM|nr:ankyrin repeat domain-containing protein [Legionella cardiaca]WED44245.1 ankyrin repeat domain-containing protein [Legionella cardiaca]
MFRASVNSNNRKLKNYALQKEYLIIDPTNERPLLGTESVRSCCAIFIYHPSRSAMVHWDDNTCHNDLDLFVKEFLKDDLALKDCTVTLVGGWPDHPESKKCSEFIKTYFTLDGVKLNLEHFQAKRSKGTWSQQGFFEVYLDVRTGEIVVNSNWPKNPSLPEDVYRGLDSQKRDANREMLDLTHLQDDQFPDSGTHIYPRDNFHDLQQKQATQLCMAAKKNDIPALIKLIDEGITHVNVSPNNAKGCTPLHYACLAGSFEAAYLLIKNGGDLLKTNDAGRTPLHYINKENNALEYRKLSTLYRLVKFNSIQNPTFLMEFSVFSRHQEQVKSSQISAILGLIENETSLAEIESQLSNFELN